MSTSNQILLDRLVNEIFIGLEDAHAEAESPVEKAIWVERIEACEKLMEELQLEIEATEQLIQKEA